MQRAAKIFEGDENRIRLAYSKPAVRDRQLLADKCLT